MTREERLDAHIEKQLRVWAYGVTTAFRKHNPRKAQYEQRRFGDIPAGTWVYFSADVPLGVVQADRTVLGSHGDVYRPAAHAFYPFRTGEPREPQEGGIGCPCQACETYRTCLKGDQ